MGPMNGLDACKRQNLHDRSRADDSTERGRDHQPCQADGRGDRPDVPQRVRAGLAVRAGNRPPHASWLWRARGSRATAWQAMLRSSTGKTAARADAALASNKISKTTPCKVAWRSLAWTL